MDRQTWNRFVLEHGPRSGRFLQSWEWGEFQKAVGEQVNRQVFEEDSQMIGLAQWLVRPLSVFGSYWFCPKGPIGAWQPRNSNAMFLRIEPVDSDLPTFAHKSIELDPAHTRITDLSISENDLLAAMHPKTRYNVRLAQKHGVNVNVTGGTFASVWELFEQTAVRGQFRLHRRDYYEKMLESLKDGACRAFLAASSHGNDLLAANIMIDFGDTRTYLHGVSSNEHRRFMAPYLLHWELMRDAKERGFAFYDWWGVAPANAPEGHPWAGISRFKRGFPGVEYVSPGTFDLVRQPFRYDLYQFGRAFVRAARRYL